MSTKFQFSAAKRLGLSIPVHRNVETTKRKPSNRGYLGWAVSKLPVRMGKIVCNSGSGSDSCSGIWDLGSQAHPYKTGTHRHIWVKSCMLFFSKYIYYHKFGLIRLIIA